MIAVELWEALTAYRLPGEQMQCLMFIFRKTYGFHKKQDSISVTQFVEATGIIKNNVVRAIKSLLSKKIINVIKKDNIKLYIYEINKNYKQWTKLSKKITVSKKITRVINIDTGVIKIDIPINIETKDTLQKIKDNTLAQSQTRFAQFWACYPKKKSKGQAEKAWKKINPDEQLLATMIATIERAKKSDDWARDKGQYIPYPATWLNAKGWEDAFETETRQGCDIMEKCSVCGRVTGDLIDFRFCSFECRDRANGGDYAHDARAG